MYGALVAASDLVSLEAATNSIKHEMKPALVDKNVKIVEEAYKTIKSQ
jgi:Pyruvate/2-oxoacid:ferredoxin oxidoreductase gamma subunit